MKKHYFLLPIFLLLLGLDSRAQSRYLVYFKDKANSPFSVQKPEAYLSERAISRRQRQAISITSNDFPVNPAYLQAVGQTGAKILFASRWFNAALLEATDAQLATIKNLSFFKSIERNLPLATSTTQGIARQGAVYDKLGSQETIDFGRMRDQLAMLGIPEMNEQGFQGQGMLIAVLDAGFLRANEVGYLKPLFDSKRVVDAYDFISRNTNVYDDHRHGLNCLSIMAANQPGTMVGAAPRASYVLYRTENDLSETPYEEATWVIGAERADSLGADIISSSLGYNEFDDPKYNYSIKDLNGKTALISRAALIAARKGMLVVNSAGNSGNDPWRYITPPADADSVLAVGATYANLSYAPFSSVGPTADGRIKPDVAAQGLGTVIGNSLGVGSASTGNGTSFSAPLISGLAAVLWQKYPFLSAQQLIQVLQKSGHQAARPDSLLGYGVPTAQRAETIINREYAPLSVAPASSAVVEVYPNPAQTELYLRFENKYLPVLSEIRILSTSGVELGRQSLLSSTQTSVSVASLPAGMYFIKITTPQGVQVVKFVKR